MIKSLVLNQGKATIDISIYIYEVVEDWEYSMQMAEFETFFQTQKFLIRYVGTRQYIKYIFEALMLWLFFKDQTS